MGKREYEAATDALRVWGEKLDEAVRIGHRSAWAAYACVFAAAATYGAYTASPAWFYVPFTGIVVAGVAIAYWGCEGIRLQRELHAAHTRYIALRQAALESDVEATDVIATLERTLAAERAFNHELQRRRAF